jgi:hypothetical protein
VHFRGWLEVFSYRRLKLSISCWRSSEISLNFLFVGRDRLNAYPKTCSRNLELRGFRKLKPAATSFGMGSKCFLHTMSP